MLSSINVWMGSKAYFGPVSLCGSSDVAIVPKKALELQCISHIRLSLWILLILLLLFILLMGRLP